MTTTILKFGKFKGQQFSETPTWYQNWLLKQDWFKAPQQSTEIYNPSKEISVGSSRLANWNGYSKRGEAIYNNIFEAEKAEEDLIFNDPSPMSPLYDGSW